MKYFEELGQSIVSNPYWIKLFTNKKKNEWVINELAFFIGMEQNCILDVMIFCDFFIVCKVYFVSFIAN